MLRVVAVLSLALAACTVGEELPVGGDPGGDDDSPPDEPPPPDDNVTCGPPLDDRAVRLSPPSTAHLHSDDNTTKAGQSCIVAGCHAAGGAGPTFTMAGTLYKPGGVEPATGAEIRIVPDGGGAALIAKTDAAGNFTTSQPFPGIGSTLASGCPSPDQKMAGKITSAADANCNGGTACHQNPGGVIMALPDN